MTIFLSSGEASGDHYTANIARALRRAGYEDELWGMGSAESREAGVRCDWDGEQLQLLGLSEIFSSVPNILRLMNEVVAKIIETMPSAVIVADSPDYHLRLIKKLRRSGYTGKIFYISPPTVWAWRSWRTKELRRNVDASFPLFEFEHEFLLARGCRSYWIGHPFSGETGTGLPDFEDCDNIVAFFPGSRSSEVKSLLPVMESAARELEADGWQPVFSVAPGLNQEVRAELTAHLKKQDFKYYEGSGRDLIRAAACSVAASGTITVEALLVGGYQVVLYRLNALSALVARLFIKTEYFAMANILSGEEIFPELLQERATSENVVRCARQWLGGSSAFREDICRKMDEARLKLGAPGAYDFWASKVMEAI